MPRDLTGKYDHKDVGATMIGSARADTYRISFTNRRGEICTIYRSTAWVRRAIRQGTLIKCGKEGMCPTS